jgi:hypothetical protein
MSGSLGNPTYEGFIELAFAFTQAAKVDRRFDDDRRLPLVNRITAEATRHD